MQPSSTRIPVARPSSRSTRICSEAGDLVAVGWAVQSGGSRRLRLRTSIMAVQHGPVAELAAIITVHDKIAGPLPVASVVANGTLVAKTPLLNVPMRPGFGRVFRGTVLLPVELVDGREHDVVVSVAARRTAEDDTVPDLGVAASDPVVVQTLRFYAKRFSRAS